MPTASSCLGEKSASAPSQKASRCLDKAGHVSVARPLHTRGLSIPLTYAPLSPTRHQTPNTKHQSPIINHQSPISNHVEMAPQAGVNGVLPVAVLQKNAPSQPSRGPKQAQPRLKLVCRRLPPGLTRSEFETMVGDEWKPGAGKVDWVNWRKGKISKDAAKPSRPARAYIHVTKQEHVPMLGDRIRDSTFHDAAKSWQDSALVGPPTLEFAPFSKMPGGRRRNDNRQGTIDQDQEFKDFLESLTNPITKSAAPDDTQKQDKVKTTPLIEALREKKANKDKPNAKGRNARGDAKEDATEKKASGKQGKENAATAGDKNRRISKADKAQAAKEAVKILNKEAASAKESSAAEKGNASPAPERKRGNVAGVKSLLQRDLGIGATPNRRRGTKREVASAAADAAPPKETPVVAQKSKDGPAAAASSSEKTQAAKKERPTRAERRAFKASLTDKTNDKTNATATATETKTQTPTKTSTAPAPQILKKPQSAQSPALPKGPAASRPPPTEPAAARNAVPPAQANNTAAKPTPAASSAPRAAPPPPAPAATSKQAFLKHANPSQGITEPLIEESLKIFGAIDKVEIDKRKGFAYVDFTEPEGLRKAMAASPIKIAQGAVQVLERKEKVARPALNPRFNGPPPTGPARGGRGGFGPGPRGGRGARGGARGGGHVAATPTSGPADSAPVPAAAPAPTPVASNDAAT
ncbi:hypothetical protein HBH56_039590 [Parastagonospora nodorum]|nr:hypothetical protein HBH56_039590 [Parastagonospora nodorum]KAH3933936.1 hypothetical protein HBH54_059870 [Parastagonospora nodorum]KAH3958017.1 hypothetical protein HBH51_216090 [Parastagonospora nodorum]KAH4143118.1 hypothetical protein HBH45_040840 [Parastagonospora nodorum]KAH4175254.1 hypothetical protein HBH44_007830 [Parastagonospora nodorum]